MASRWKQGWGVSGGFFILLMMWLAVGSAFSQSSPSDIFVDEDSVEEEEEYESLVGFTGYGASLGGIKFFGPSGVDGSKTKFVLQGNFRYRFGERWIGSGEFGFGWNSFEARGDTVLAVNFGSLSLLREFSGYQGMTWRVGGGAGLYGWNYKFDGKSIRDRGSQQFYNGFDPGLVLTMEAERRIGAHTTLSAALQDHYIFSADDKFDDLFDSNLNALIFRLGIHFHFSPYEGILWEGEDDLGGRLGSGEDGQ